MSCFLHAARLRSLLSTRKLPHRVDSVCPRRVCNSEASYAVPKPSRPPESGFGLKKGKFTELIEVSDKESMSFTRRIKTVSAARALQGISTEDLVFNELSSAVQVARARINELSVVSDKDLNEHVVFSRRVCNLLSPLVKHRRVLAVLLGRSEKITQGSYGSLNELNYNLGKVLDPWMLRFSRYKQRDEGEAPDANAERARLRTLKNNLDNLSLKLQKANVVDWPKDDVGYVRSYLDKALRDPAKSQERTGRATKPVSNPKLSAEQRLAAAMRATSTAVDDPVRDASFRAGLKAHLELLLHLKRPHDAVETFYHYLRVSAADDTHPRVAHRDLFNIVLRTEAEQGHLKGVKKFFALMTDFGVEPTATSFASVLECVGRSKNHHPLVPTTETMDHVLAEMSDRKITVDDVVHCFGNSMEQKHFICEAIRSTDPNFEMPGIKLDLKYVESNQLLSELRVESCDAPGPNVGVLTKDQVETLAQEQLATEVHGYVDVEAISRLSEAFVPKEQDAALSELATKKLAEVEKSWQQTLTDVFANEVAALESQIIGLRRQHCITLLPYLQVLPPSDYVDIMMQEIRRLSEGSETFSLSTRAMSKQLGAIVMHRYFVKRKVDCGIMAKVEELYDKYLDHTVAPEEGQYDIPRVAWQKLIAGSKSGPDIEALPMIWPVNTMVAVGKVLHQIVVSHIKIDARLFNVTKNPKPLMVPAFFKLFRSQGVITREELKVHPTVAKLFRLGSTHPLRFDAEVVPMVSPPLPWISNRMGGYLTSSAKIVRLPFGAQQQLAELNRVPPQQLYPTYDSLNQLGSVPWIVNEPVLDLAIEVFVAGGDDSLEVPKPPSACPPPPVITSDMSKKDKYKAFQEKSQLKRVKGEMYSLWCDALYKLSIANHFRKKILWFPHNIDFRGRAYPCPPHFNHLGADLTRSLLMFAKGVPLGEQGFDWLKIHLINLTGHKKRDPVRRRLAYANDMIGEIMDSAERPLTGNGWWKSSDEPWQTLAACKEVVAALRSENGPEAHVSHFPVHQDGSCNGLQHYAALGRDPQGAFSVNLVPADEPQDVYSDVANMVEQERQKDADNGVKIAKQLEGLIKRKVIKQTVMTTVYGVTRFGARLQIAKQLKDLDDFPQDLCFAASQYLTGKTFHCLQEMFTGTKFIQDWFTECARLISGVCGQSVEWVSPLGLPVVQPYHRLVKRPVSEAVDFHRLRSTLPNVMDKCERPNTMKQKNAFPPNFIHSLDSCHMMLTSLSCQKAGISFISVHDCYWTHPSTVNYMNEICRNQFVALHSQPILEDLRDFLVKKYSFNERELDDTGSVLGIAKRKLNRVLTEVPEKGSFDLEQVKQSTYFFS